MSMNCDGWDPNPPEEGYCIHGVYVGGCGWDLMCGACEMGEPALSPEEEWIAAQERYLNTLARLEREFDGYVEVVQCVPMGYGVFGRLAQTLEDIAEGDRFYTLREAWS